MKQIITLLFILSFVTINSQDLAPSITEIQTLLQDVAGKNSEMKQSIEQTKPSTIRVLIENVSVKGKVIASSYEFSPADIDLNTIRATTNKDFIVVNLQAKSKQKMIKLIKNNEVISYVNKLTIYAVDIKNGRALEEKFKETVPIAKEIIENRLQLSSYDDYTAWLTENVGNVVLTKKQFNQEFQIQPEYFGSVVFNQEVGNAKKVILNSYKFNLLNIMPRSVVFDVNANIFNVVLSSNDKLIKHSVDGNHKRFVKTFKVAFEQIEKAKDFQKVIKSLIKISKEKFNNSLTKISSISQGIDQLNTITNNIVVNEYSYTQNLDGEAVVHFEQTQESKGKSKVYGYDFNFVDINKRKIEIDTNTQFFFLQLSTLSSNKFIKSTLDELQKPYINKLKIFTPDIESSLVLQATIEQIIELAEKENEAKTIPGSDAELINALTEKVQNVTINENSFEQDFSIGDDNLFKLIRIEVKKKATAEKLFECFLSDLNPDNVRLVTKGKRVNVELKTNKLEKIIKYYINGEIKNYQNTVVIEATDIENARNLVKLLQKLIENNQD